MKTWTLAMAMLIAGTMHGEKLANGLEFRTPDGWTVKAVPEAALLMPPDMVMEPDGKEPSELYLVAVMPGIQDLQDPRLLSILQSKFFPAESQVRPVDTAQSFHSAGGPGYLYLYDAVSQGTTLRMQIYVVGLRGGGVAGLVAVARPALLMLRSTAVANVAASLSRQAAAAPAPAPQTMSSAPAAATAANSAMASQWDQRLRGRKLYQFSNYNSGYGGGGMNSQKTLLLSANGTFDFRHSSATSIYVSGANGGSTSQGGSQGHWRIYEQAGKVMLELTPSNGPVENIVLTSNAGKTLLNGNRWLVGD